MLKCQQKEPQKVFLKIIQNINICRCNECIDDIKAKALNNIKPHYVTGKIGEVYSEYNMLDYQNSTTIVMEVAKAIEHINNNRKHNL